MTAAAMAPDKKAIMGINSADMKLGSKHGNGTQNAADALRPSVQWITIRDVSP